MALAGSAVGLGNLWRFPYLVGQHGGAAFILIYLGCVIFLALPIMLSEFIIGRKAQANAITAFKKLAPGTGWYLTGVMGILTAILIFSFYSVVGGWGIKYLVDACTLKFVPQAQDSFADAFSNFTADAAAPVVYHLIFLALTVGIVVLGVKKGIEKFAKIMMPVLFVLVIVIAVRAISLPGARAGLDYLFKPDFSKVSSKTFLAALGQSFFSLSLGMGTIITYSSYAKRDESVIRDSVYTSFFDTIFAIIAGCAIIPAVFAFGLSPHEGPGLLFVTLPYIFASMPLGSAAAILFFISLLLAALTSSISIIEVAVAFFVEHFNMKRGKAVALCSVVLAVMGTLCSLSLGAVPQISLFGKSLFDLFDYVTSNVLMTIGSILVVVFVGWKLGKKVIKEELSNNGTLHIPDWVLNMFSFLIRYVSPAAVLAIMIF